MHNSEPVLTADRAEPSRSQTLARGIGILLAVVGSLIYAAAVAGSLVIVWALHEFSTSWQF